MSACPITSWTMAGSLPLSMGAVPQVGGDFVGWDVDARPLPETAQHDLDALRLEGVVGACDVAPAKGEEQHARGGVPRPLLEHVAVDGAGEVERLRFWRDAAR